MIRFATLVRRSVVAGTILAALSSLAGCEDTGYNPYMTDAMLSVNDYQQSVYDNANAAGDEYIRQ